MDTIRYRYQAIRVYRYGCCYGCDSYSWLAKPMSLNTSCNKCGRIGPNALCDLCKIKYRRKPVLSRQQRGYDSEYDRNRQLMIDHSWLYQLPCVLCQQGFDKKSDITAEHVIPLRVKRDNSYANLKPAHERCNKQWRANANRPKQYP